MDERPQAEDRCDQYDPGRNFQSAHMFYSYLMHFVSDYVQAVKGFEVSISRKEQDLHVILFQRSQ